MLPVGLMQKKNGFCRIDDIKLSFAGINFTRCIPTGMGVIPIPMVWLFPIPIKIPTIDLIFVPFPWI